MAEDGNEQPETAGIRRALSEIYPPGKEIVNPIESLRKTAQLYHSSESHLRKMRKQLSEPARSSSGAFSKTSRKDIFQSKFSTFVSLLLCG